MVQTCFAHIRKGLLYVFVAKTFFDLIFFIRNLSQVRQISTFLAISSKKIIWFLLYLAQMWVVLIEKGWLYTFSSKKILTPTFYKKLKQRKKSFKFLAISWINRLIYLYIWYKRALYLLKKDWLYIFSSKQFLLPFFYKKLKQRKAYFQFFSPIFRKNQFNFFLYLIQMCLVLIEKGWLYIFSAKNFYLHFFYNKLW